MPSRSKDKKGVIFTKLRDEMQYSLTIAHSVPKTMAGITLRSGLGRGGPMGNYLSQRLLKPLHNFHNFGSSPITRVSLVKGRVSIQSKSELSRCSTAYNYRNELSFSNSNRSDVGNLHSCCGVETQFFLTLRGEIPLPIVLSTTTVNKPLCLVIYGGLFHPPLMDRLATLSSDNCQWQKDNPETRKAAMSSP
ncbi:hypothetical protein POTOM_034380 [Populus tomentosa]|uniref:Uncharacterized protein n=1 Tax=Populus tomentosa TaxID=118781 RepID=A0A8X8CP04_POPTO|nr:hypothetical protein POTOM_034380 [Populus tomentosa]